MRNGEGRTTENWYLGRTTFLYGTNPEPLQRQCKRNRHLVWRHKLTVAARTLHKSLKGGWRVRHYVVPRAHTHKHTIEQSM